MPAPRPTQSRFLRHWSVSTAFWPLLLGTALLAATAVALAAALGITGRAPFVAACLVLAAAVVVGESIVLSLFRALTGPALLGAQGLGLLAALAAWVACGRPRPPSFRPPPPRALLRLARAQPLLALLVALVVAGLGLQAVLAVAVAPNETDSIAYHLPRAAYWVQYHTALQYLPGSLDDPTQSHPPNAELLVAWTMALSRSDAYAQIVQWLAMLGTMAMIFTGARMVGLARTQAAFAAAVFALLPVPLIQSATTQNDLLLTFLLTAALVFAVTGLRARARAPLLVAALATGLAVGTKLDFVFIAPAAVLILGATLRATGPPLRLVAFGAAATVAAVLALGSFNYVQNELNTHTLTGFSGTPNGDFIKAGPLLDAARTAWNMVEAPDLPVPDWVSDPAETVVASLFKGLHGSYFDAPSPAIASFANADSSAYGLVGLFVLLPLLAVAIASPRARRWQRLLALCAVSYFAAYSLALGYNPESGRYLMPAAALAAPLFGLLHGRRLAALATVALLAATLPAALLHESYKPVLAGGSVPSIFSLDRLGQQTLDDDTLLGPLRRLGAILGPHTALGFIAQDNLEDYLLFGEPLARRLVAFDDPTRVTRRVLRAHHLRYLFVAFADQSPCVGRVCLTHRAGLRFTSLGDQAYLVAIG